MADAKRTLLKLIYWSGGNAVCRFVLRHKPRIVMLHKVERDEAATESHLPVSSLRAMLRTIARHYSPLRLKDFLELRHAGACPTNAVVLTFDDGFKSFYDLAFPLLKEFNVPATVFVCPSLVDAQSCIWPDRLEALHASGFREESGKSFEVLLDEMKRMGTEARNSILEKAQASLGIPIDIPPPHQLMDWSMVREVSRSDLVEVGSHTQTHPILANEPRSVARDEIFGSKARLEEMLGIEIKTFCYPNGQIGDFTQEQARMIEEAGYSGAVAAYFGIVEPDSDRYSLPRISGGHHSPQAFFKYLDGIEHFQQKLLG